MLDKVQAIIDYLPGAGRVDPRRDAIPVLISTVVPKGRIRGLDVLLVAPIYSEQ